MIGGSAECFFSFPNGFVHALSPFFLSFLHHTHTWGIKITTSQQTAAAQPVAEMEGQWWVSYGYNLVYDAFPCQRLTFSAINATTWLYDSEYGCE